MGLAGMKGALRGGHGQRINEASSPCLEMYDEMALNALENEWMVVDVKSMRRWWTVHVSSRPSLEFSDVVADTSKKFPAVAILYFGKQAPQDMIPKATQGRTSKAGSAGQVPRSYTHYAPHLLLSLFFRKSLVRDSRGGTTSSFRK